MNEMIKVLVPNCKLAQELHVFKSVDDALMWSYTRGFSRKTVENARHESDLADLTFYPLIVWRKLYSESPERTEMFEIKFSWAWFHC